MTTKLEILQEALTHRTDEILQYQINIDNYTLAIAKIQEEHSGDTPMDAAMQNFLEHLQTLLQSTLVEQRKSQIILDVVQSQVNDLLAQ